MGSRGDVLPFLALGHGLVARGHAVRIATSSNHAALVAAAGLPHIRMRPEPTRTARAETEAGRTPDIHRLMAEVIAPGIRDGHADLVEACGGGACDLLLGSVVPIAPMAAETLGIPWAPAVLQPIAFLSAHDPPVPPDMPWMSALNALGKLAGWPQRLVAHALLARSARPFAEARRALGLRPARDPLLNWAAPPPFGLALFSPELAAAQPDWLAGARPTGFCRWPDGTLPPEVEAFLAEGPPPLVVSLGSSMVRVGGLPQAIHAAALAVARRAGLRCLVLAGTAENLAALPAPLPPGCLGVLGAPHGAVFPRAALILHHGGAGTTGEAMRAGRPMLVVPFAGDQFDHAARMVRRGVAATCPARRLDEAALEAMLRRVMAPGFAARAAALGAALRAEDGVAGACAVIEGWLRRRRA
jgi:UDP:flavonoid glycosyltransferase YjiC (YdhE family)